MDQRCLAEPVRETPLTITFPAKAFYASGTTKIDRNLDGVLTLINETLSRTVAPVKQFLGLLV
jgi:hypothetical protein